MEPPTSADGLDRLLKLEEVCDLLERSRAIIYPDISREAFPHPVKLGKSSRWRASDVRALMAGNGTAAS